MLTFIYINVCNVFKVFKNIKHFECLNLECVLVVQVLSFSFVSYHVSSATGMHECIKGRWVHPPKYVDTFFTLRDDEDD